jgi:hypothetical protein
MAGSPFAGASTGEQLNPYASPAFAGYEFAAQPGARSGLPWENKYSFRSWWETMTLVLTSPSLAFLQMRQAGGMGGPILFGFSGLAVPGGLFALLAIPLIVIMSFGQPGNRIDAGQVGMGLGMGLGFLLVVLVYILMYVTIGALIWASVTHLCLRLVGGARQGFERTFRVVSFSQGAIAPVSILLGCIPFGLGYLIQIVWTVSLLIIGISRAHETTTGKAAVAVLLPTGLCVAVMIGFVGFAIYMDTR